MFLYTFNLLGIHHRHTSGYGLFESIGLWQLIHQEIENYEESCKPHPESYHQGLTWALNDYAHIQSRIVIGTLTALVNSSVF